jgi:hypothetical protein
MDFDKCVHAQVCGDGLCSTGESVLACPRDCAPSIQSPTSPNKVFLFFNADQARTWHQAQEYCQALGGNLASVWDEQEYGALRQLSMQHNLLSDLSAFLGLTDHGSEGIFLWSDGSKPAYTTLPWGLQPNQPDDHSGDQDCVRLCKWKAGDTKLSLDDIFCQSSLPFFCGVCSNGLQTSDNCLPTGSNTSCSCNQTSFGRKCNQTCDVFEK